MPGDASGSVAGIVLAAGSSTRMGQNKLLLQLDGEPVVRRVVTNAVAAGLNPVLVVLGFEAQLVRAALAGLAHAEVVNPEFHRGINRSVQLGIAAVPPGVSAAVVILADMPFVSADMIAEVVTRYTATGAPLVISRYGAVRAPPTLYDRTLFAEFSEADGEGCGKRVVKRHLDEAVALDWPPAALSDVDTPEDFRRVQSIIDNTST